MKKEGNWNVGDVVKEVAFGYMDWEGFASGEGIVEDIEPYVKTVRGTLDIEGIEIPEESKEQMYQMYGDILLHFAYQVRDATDAEVYQSWKKENLEEIAWVLWEVLTTRYISTSKHVWK